MFNGIIGTIIAPQLGYNVKTNKNEQMLNLPDKCCNHARFCRRLYVNNTHILICDDDPVVHESLDFILTQNIFRTLRHTMERRLKIRLGKAGPRYSRSPDAENVRHGRLSYDTKTSNVPIIMLTAKGEEIDRVLGLELGADDYIVKPFSPREVIARIKAVFRRIHDTETGQKPSILRFEGLEINLDNYQVKVNNKVVPFTPKEVEILYLLASHPGQVMNREQILSKVWGYDYFGDTRTVDTHIKRIRQKIDNDSLTTDLLQYMALVQIRSL